MYQFLWPVILLLLPLPWLVRKWMKPGEGEMVLTGALKVPFFNRLKKLNGGSVAERRLVSPFFWGLAWFFFVVAAARPVWIGEAQQVNRDARNIVLTLDVSASMEEKDFDVNGRPITRLNIVKNLAKDFIQKRTGDNIGLVIFGSEAYTYAPISPDTKTLEELLSEIGIGIAGNQTAMGDALALAVQTASAVPENARIVILMSDGISNAGVIQMDEALRLAQQAHVKVYTIGIGSDKQSLQNFFGFIQNSSGLDLDEATLKKVASDTGGQYFRAKSTRDLKQIYDTIDTLEAVESEDVTVRPRKELAYVLILCGLACWILAFLSRRVG